MVWIHKQTSSSRSSATVSTNKKSNCASAWNWKSFSPLHENSFLVEGWKLYLRSSISIQLPFSYCLKKSFHAPFARHLASPPFPSFDIVTGFCLRVRSATKANENKSELQSDYRGDRDTKTLIINSIKANKRRHQTEEEKLFSIQCRLVPVALAAGARDFFVSRNPQHEKGSER